METNKPATLIALLEQLLAETDKMNVGRIYISIIEALKRSIFEERELSNSNTIYKHLVQLSIKDFIHSGRSEASANVIRDVIAALEKTTVSS